MSFHAAALTFLIDGALGAWLGVMAFFSFVGAPRAFAVFGDDAAAYVDDVFPRYYRVGLALGNVAFVAGLVLGYLAGFDGAMIVVVVSTAIGVVLTAYSLGGLIPKMARADEAGFERYHRQSVILNGLTMLAVVVGLVASHL